MLVYLFFQLKNALNLIIYMFLDCFDDKNNFLKIIKIYIKNFKKHLLIQFQRVRASFPIKYSLLYIDSKQYTEFTCGSVLETASVNTTRSGRIFHSQPKPTNTNITRSQ